MDLWVKSKVVKFGQNFNILFTLSKELFQSGKLERNIKILIKFYIFWFYSDVHQASG